MYNSNLHKKENKEIKKTLEKYISEKDVVLDIGCGTGLFVKILNNYRKYIGIDISNTMIEYCKKKFLPSTKCYFFCCDANKIKELGIKNIDHIISLFSLNYMKTKIIKQAIKNSNKYFIAIHYNKPYKSETSVYSKRKLLFLILHKLKQRKIKKELKKYNAKTFKLLDQDFYYVSIVKK